MNRSDFDLCEICRNKKFSVTHRQHIDGLICAGCLLEEIEN